MSSGNSGQGTGSPNEGSEQREAATDRQPSAAEALSAGALAGLAATVPMTAAMLAMQRLLPPFQRYPLPPEQIAIHLAVQGQMLAFLNRRVRQAVRLGLHFGYGAGVGAGYGLLSRYLALPRIPLLDRLPNLSVGGRRISPAVVLSGIIYALGVWAVSYLGWLPALGILRPATDHPSQRNALMIAAHVVWGSATALLAELWTARGGEQASAIRQQAAAAGGESLAVTQAWTPGASGVTSSSTGGAHGTGSE